MRTEEISARDSNGREALLRVVVDEERKTVVLRVLNDNACMSLTNYIEGYASQAVKKLGLQGAEWSWVEIDSDGLPFGVHMEWANNSASNPVWATFDKDEAEKRGWLEEKRDGEEEAAQPGE